MIFPRHPLLRHAGGAAGFKNQIRFLSVRFGHPTLRLLIAQPIVGETGKAQQVGKTFDVLCRIPARFLCPFQPERRTRSWREMPFDDLTHMRVESVFCSRNSSRFGQCFRAFGGNGLGNVHRRETPIKHEEEITLRLPAPRMYLTV